MADRSGMSGLIVIATLAAMGYIGAAIATASSWHGVVGALLAMLVAGAIGIGLFALAREKHAQTSKAIESQNRPPQSRHDT